MFPPVNKKSSIAAVAEWVGKFKVETTPDGLSMVPPADEKSIFDGLAFPPHLAEWLTGLRLLRNIPLCYLVPDPALLPPESIRFFHIDYTWIDRDRRRLRRCQHRHRGRHVRHPSCRWRARIDKAVEDLAKAKGDTTGWTFGTKPLTGMFIRSNLSGRPDMTQAFAAEAKKMAVLRAEPISKDIYIALFAGQPQPGSASRSPACSTASKGTPRPIASTSAT